MRKKPEKKLPKIGFITVFCNLGETLPLVEIAKKYIKLGGEAVFIGYGTNYENLARAIGCKVIKIREKYFTYDSQKSSKKSKKFKDKVLHQEIPPEIYSTLMFDKKLNNINLEAIEKEIKIFKDEKIELIVTGPIFTSRISAKVAKIPIIFVMSGVSVSPYFESNCATFPDNFENFITHLFPKVIKNRLINWYMLHSKLLTNGFNRLARQYEIPALKRCLDLCEGNYTLIADNMYFLSVKPTPDFPSENYVDPIFPSYCFEQHRASIDPEIEAHLRRPGKSILLTMGSSGFMKKNFLKILKILNNSEYNVIATYTTILKDSEIPTLNENILLRKYIQNISAINKKVDLAIIHGGRGTVYTAAYSGKPAIGYPLHQEQQYNLDSLARHGSAIRLSFKFFNEKKLIEATREIFENYDKFLKNAKLLKNKLPAHKGAENAAKRIIEIIA